MDLVCTSFFLLCCCASIPLRKCQPFMGCFEMTQVLLQVVLHARLKERGTGVQHVASGLYRGNEVNCVSGACRAGLKCAWPSGWKQRRTVGREEKFPTRRGRTTLTEPLQSHFFMPLKDFPCHPFAFLLRNTVFTFPREKSDFFTQVKAPAPWSCSASKWTPSYELAPIRTSWAMTESCRACWP